MIGRSTRTRGLLPPLFLIVCAGLLLALHSRRLELAPLTIYGHQGAEYLEWLQLEHASDLLSSWTGWDRLWHLPDLLSLLDGEYPALLHIIGAYVDMLPAALPGLVARFPNLEWLPAGWQDFSPSASPPASHSRWGSPWFGSLRINIVWLGVLAWGSALLCSSLVGRVRRPARETPPPGAASTGAAATGAAVPFSSSAGWYTACSVLLTPALFGASHRYYYDLPMASLSTLACVFLVQDRGLSGWKSLRATLLAALFTGLACLMKWQALLYLGPAWLWWGLGERRQLMPVRLARFTLSLGLFTLLCWPVLRRSLLLSGARQLLATASGGPPPTFEPGASFDMALQQAGGGAAPLELLEPGLFYAMGVWQSLLGPLICLGVSLVWLSSTRAWRTCIPVLLWMVPVLAFLLLRGGVTDERYLLPLLPLGWAALWATWAIASSSGSTSGSADTGHKRRSLHALPPLLVLGLALFQLADFEGILTLPEALQARGSIELRGWNRLDEGRPSPHGRYLAEARALCASRSLDHIWIEPAQAGDGSPIHAWRWALEHGCPRSQIEIGRPGQVEQDFEGGVWLTHAADGEQWQVRASGDAGGIIP